MADYLTFQNLYQKVCTAIADPNYSRADLDVKTVINMVYLNEICQCDELYPLFWLLECDDSKKSKARATITGISKASPAVVTATAHGFVTGDIITIYEVSGMTEVNFRTFHVTKVTADTFSLQDLTQSNVSSSAYTTYSSGGYAHHRGTLLTSCAKVLRANWHGYNKGMAFINYDELEDQATYWDKSRSRPIKMMHRREYTAAGAQYDYLLWFQAADAAYNLRLWYEKQVARLSADGDVPILPYQFHDAIIAGAITRLGENRVQVENAVIWPVLYKSHIEAIKAFNRKYWQENKPYERSPLFLA